jgi:inhibitor of KinA sporulation pathway (predicted exonuclease)
LDFEWTCDDGEDRQVHSNEGEIIEFAFVVFDVKLGRDVCEGQYYCKPQRTQVTEYCTDLTGISEETLKGAGSLGDALDAFEFELDRAGLTGRRCCAVTHGPCDLELTLPRNCGAIGRKVPSVLRSYVDLREAAQAYVRSKGILGARASTLRQICDALGVEMIGDEHCGLDDAWMVLLCFQVLLNSKMDLQIIDIDAERQKFLDSTCTERVLALDGLPWPAREIEIQSWLEGLLGYRLPANSVRIILGLDNRPSGRGMVDMGNRCNALAAFKVLACNAFSPGGCMMSMDDENFGALERLVLVRPLRRQERIELP